jgi:glycerol-3-phosphate acyltransferase PlsY
MREQGSGSTGATNVLRTLGKGPAIVVFAVDLLKGVAAPMGGAYLYGHFAVPSEVAIFTFLSPEWLGCVAALCSLLGHSKPIWLGFRGGKSVATGLGVVFGMNWIVALATFSAFGLTLALFRIVSLGSIVASLALNIFMWTTGQPLAYKFFALLGGSYVIWRHQSNIQRLLTGDEPKIGQPLPKT